MTLNSAPVSSKNSYELRSILIDTRGDLRNASLDDGKCKSLGSLLIYTPTSPKGLAAPGAKPEGRAPTGKVGVADVYPDSGRPTSEP